ncbi:hypothetical protein HPB52_003089 [Rhipicephalus sanguineus]|uniref:Uncharacterized protein n=1 Tax=Rhipicephalus sanguineus TaxID=34632 RepID=A0A9D4PPG5_RHISA|nr:hypothetical protein HPB52_003089 [Rhipicephalus sanguineus]
MSIRRPIVLNAEDVGLGTLKRIITADKQCRQRYQVPYVVRVRRQERARVELAAEQEAVVAAQLASVPQRSRGCSRSRSCSKSRRQSSSGTPAPRSHSVSIGGGGGAAGGRATWADKVKGSITGRTRQGSKPDGPVEVPRSVEAAKENMADEETPSPKKRAVSSTVRVQAKTLLCHSMRHADM